MPSSQNVPVEQSVAVAQPRTHDRVVASQIDPAVGQSAGAPHCTQMCNATSQRGRPAEVQSALDTQARQTPETGSQCSDESGQS
jgi:hypothetical protein